MNPARLRVVRAALLLPVPLVVLLGLSRPSPAPRAAPPTAEPAAETSVLKPDYAETFAFFDQGRASPGTGRGLFETDYFRPPPPPPPPPAPPKPAPPPPKRVLAAYRGFAAFGANTVAYVSVDGRTVTLAPGETVAEGWKITSFDADGAELARGEETFRLAFNKPAQLPAPPAK
jgi:hypothetical protein